MASSVPVASEELPTEVVLQIREGRLAQKAVVWHAGYQGHAPVFSQQFAEVLLFGGYKMAKELRKKGEVVGISEVRKHNE